MHSNSGQIYMDGANVNEFSSRSHAVVTLRATTFDVVGTSCSVQIVVQAGSHRFGGKRTPKVHGTIWGPAGGRRADQSLFTALGDVMNALTEPRGATKRHIVYREFEADSVRDFQRHCHGTFNADMSVSALSEVACRHETHYPSALCTVSVSVCILDQM